MSAIAEEIARLLYRARGRAARSAPVTRIRGAAARREAERLAFSDATLAVVRQALVTEAAGEADWSRRVEAKRAVLAASADTVTFAVDDTSWWELAIQRSRDPFPPVLRGHDVTRNVGEITRTTSKAAGWGRLFFRIVRGLRPQRCLELGSSVGMSACYIGAGLAANAEGRPITIAGLDAVADIARRALSSAGVGDRVTVGTGTFADRFGGALESLGGVDLAFIDGHRWPTSTPSRPRRARLLIFDDVSYWHEHEGGLERDPRRRPPHPESPALSLGQIAV
jgi:hypothetical protein